MPTTEPKDIHLERIPTSDTRHPEKLQPRLENLKTSAEGTLAHITDFKNQITTMIAEMSSVRSELGSSTSDLEVANTIDIRLKNLQTQIEYYERKSEALKKKIEWEKTKADCLKAVSDGIEEIKRVLAVTPATSPDHARMQWVIQAVEHAKTKAETNNTLQQDVIEPHSGQQQKEGIPVDELIEVLRGVAGASSDSTIKSKLNTIANTLHTNSKNYFDAHPEKRLNNGREQHWRTRYEASHIAKDFRATGDQDQDYQRAMEVMKNRRELVVGAEPADFTEVEPTLLAVPSATTTPRSSRSIASTPSTTTETAPVAPSAVVETESPPEITVSLTTVEDIRPPSNKIFFVSAIEIAKRLAWTQAEEKLNEYKQNWKSKQEPPTARDSGEKPGFFKRLWRGTKEVVKSIGRNTRDMALHPLDFLKATFVRLGEDKFLNKLYGEALQAIVDNQNLMSEIEVRIGKSKTKESTTSQLEKNARTLDSIIAGYVQDVAEVEEKGESVSDDEVNKEVTDLIFEFATGGTMNRQTFDAEVMNRVIPIMQRKGFRFGDEKKSSDDRVRRIDEKATKDHKLYAHNLFEVTKGYKAYVEKMIQKFEKQYGPENREVITMHVKKTMAIDIQLGLKARDVRDTKPDGIRTWSDRLVDQLQNVPVLGRIFASPTAVGAGSGVAVSMALRGLVRAPLKLLMAAPVIGALFGGVLGAMRRGRDLKYDRGMELRREALGQEAGGANALRVREYSYNKLNIDQLLPALDSIVSKDPGSITDDDKKLLVEIYARLGVEKSASIDLFSTGAEEGREMGTRIVSMNELKVRCKAIREKHVSLTPESLNVDVQARQGKIIEDVAAKDEEFASFRRREMAKAGAFGAVAGLCAGAIAESVVMGAKGNFSGSSIGRLSDFMRGNKNIGGALTLDTMTGAPQVRLVEKYFPGTDTVIKVPENIEVLKTQDTLTIIDKSGWMMRATELKLGANGHLTAESLEKMRGLGWNVSEKVDVVPGSDFFSQNLHEVVVPSLPGVTVKLPEGLELIQGQNGFDIVDPKLGKVYLSGIQFSPDGKSIMGSGISTAKELGWDVNSITTHTEEKITDHDAILNELRRRYGGGVTDYTKRNWHGNIDPRSRRVTWPTAEHGYWNDKIKGKWSEGYPYKYPAGPGEESASAQSVQEGILDKPVESGQAITGKLIEGKEVRGILLVKENEYVLEFRGLKDMMRSGGKNWDGSFDHKYGQIKHLLKARDLAESTKHFRFRYYLNDADFKAGRAFSLPMSSDGSLHIPKNSELAHLLISEQGKIQGKLSTEISMYDEDKGVAHILASQHRKGTIDSLMVPHDKTAFEFKHGVVPGKELPSYVFTPPAPVEGIAPEEYSPFVPLPFVPRKDMEKGINKKRIAGITNYYTQYGYTGTEGGYAWRSRGEYKKFQSKSIKENPRAELNETKEIQEYFDRMEPEYKNMVEEFSRLIPGMENNCRVSIGIPAYKEGERIYESLSTYLNQKNKDGTTINPSLFEVLIFDNHPVNVLKDDTEKEINRFKIAHPEIRIHYIHAVFPKKQPIGYYRKVINDVALERMQRRNNGKEHILVSHDADRYDLSDTYFDQIISAFDSDKKMDAFGGLIDYPKEAYDKLPITWASRRLWQFFDLIRQTQINKKSPDLIGQNSGFRASTYAAVGGYNPECTLGEDMEMGLLIRHARDYNPDVTKFLARAKVIGDPRRGISKMFSGGKMIEQYSNWVEDEGIRDKTWQGIISGDNTWGALDISRFEKEAQAIFDHYGQWSDLDSRKKTMIHALKIMGVKVEFTGPNQDKIKIVDAEKLVQGLKDYQASDKDTMRVLPRKKTI